MTPAPKQQWLTALAVTIGLAAFFIRFAGIDLWFSGLFWSGTEGWYLGASWWAMLMYRLIPLLVYFVAIAIPIVAIVNLVRRRPLGPFHGRALLYIFAAVAIGPGLVVNVVLKDNWGRARPRDVVEFAGAQTFTPAFVISDQCPKNCSFVAGHPSMAFALMAIVLVAARRRRTVLVTGTVVLGVLVGFGRVVQGGHFLSDVVFSGIFTVAIVAGLYRLFRPGPVDPAGAPSAPS
jgi:lipid A 4'-phosphatase